MVKDTRSVLSQTWQRAMFVAHSEVMLRGLFWLMVAAAFAVAGPNSRGSTNAAPPWVWALSSYAVVAHAVATDASGNIYVTGGFGETVSFGTTNLTSGPDGDVFVAKVNSSGQVLWVAQGRGTDSYGNIGNSIAVDSSGNVYAGGRFTGLLDFGTTNLNSGYFTWFDAFLVKFDSGGRCLWAWQGNSGESSHTYCSAVAVDSNGEVVISGHYRYRIYFRSVGEDEDGPLSNTESAFVAKFNGAGQRQWVREIASYAQNWHEANALAIDANRNIYVTGHFSREVYFGDEGGLTSRGVSDIYVAKYNASGAFQWVQQAGCTEDGNDEDDSYDEGLGIAVDRIGSVYVTGSFSAPAATFGTTNLYAGNVRDFFLAKYDSDGALQWVRKSPESSRRGVGLALDEAGDVYVLPTTLHSFVQKYDGAGNVLWIQGAEAGSQVAPHAIAVAPDGSKYVAGNRLGPLSGAAGAGPYVYLAKLDSYDTGPRLSIAVSTGSVVLSWPVAALDYGPQVADSLSEWRPASGVVGTNGILRTLTLPRPTRNQFYRLEK